MWERCGGKVLSMLVRVTQSGTDQWPSSVEPLEEQVPWPAGDQNVLI